jgi:hypothetical protein
MRTCKTCDQFNFKVSADHAWGECLNPIVIDSQKISLSLVNEVFEHPDPANLKTAIQNYARILYREDTFGCIYHQPENEIKGTLA